MSLKDALYRILVAEGHDEPVGQLDRLDGVGYSDDDGAEAEALARVEVPRGSSQGC